MHDHLAERELMLTLLQKSAPLSQLRTAGRATEWQLRPTAHAASKADFLQSELGVEAIPC